MEKISESSYKVLLSEETKQKLELYKQNIENGKVKPGSYFQEKLDGLNIQNLSSDEFLSLLVQTKKPQIYAESAVYGNGKDWNSSELSILGDINFAVPVTIYDNGVHRGDNLKSHNSPFQGELLFVPGALLRNDKGVDTPDMQEVIKNNKIDYTSFYKLYERRLLPSLIYANQSVGKEGAVITIPGIGCGQFAGKFQGQLEGYIQNILKEILKEHGSKLSNIKGVIFDPNQNTQNCKDENLVINGIYLETKAGNFGKDNSQLKKPQEHGEQFKNCKLFSVVAWDHVSWPGNDFYVGDRATDDGVKAAATNVCEVLTGIQGKYNYDLNKFNPSNKYKNWEDVINSEKIELKVPEALVLKEENLVNLNLLNKKEENFWQKKLLKKESKELIIYHAKKGELAIKCEDKESRNLLMKDLLRSGLDIKAYNDNPDTLFISCSSGIGTVGIYKAKEGELAINFSTQEKKDFFCKVIGINKKHVIPSYSHQESALYFKPEVSPYDPGSGKNLKLDTQCQLAR